ncbi:MAG: hypothetical protein IT307_19150 [Chloroflexi bacterium]|nr:hypothetical protein [Chloroflexota bacterium]
MLRFIAAALTLLSAAVWRPGVAAAADDTQTFQSSQLGISFDYPAKWQAGPRQPLGLLPNELATVAARGDNGTEFALALYRATVHVNDGNRDQLIAQLDGIAAGMMAKLSGARQLSADEADTIESSDGKVYTYQYTADRQTMRGELTLALHENLVIALVLTARDRDFDARQDDFDTIIYSLLVPWSIPDEETVTYDNPDSQITFDYPATWQTGPSAPLGLLPNETFTVATRGDASTQVALALYTLPEPVNDATLADRLGQFDAAAAAVVANLPAGKLINSEGCDDLDDASARLYSYQYTDGGQPMYGEMIVGVHEAVAIQLVSTARDGEFDGKRGYLESVRDSLYLPWSLR